MMGEFWLGRNLIKFYNLNNLNAIIGNERYDGQL